MMTKKKDSAEKAIRDIRRATRRPYSAEVKIRIVLEGLRGESSIAELCRKEGINQNLYDRWSKVFLEAGKKRLASDTAREANSDEAIPTNHSFLTGWRLPSLRGLRPLGVCPKGQSHGATST
jgi:transposase-like protein